MADILALDDNLKNGTTYTFTFELTNWLLKPSDATLLQDITDYAPDFMTSVGVTDVANVSFSLARGYRNITFTYEGDGSDVVSDVANSIAAAFKAGSNDNFQFTQATSGATGVTTDQQIADIKNTAAQAGGVVGGAAGSITQGVLSGATSGLGGWLIPIALVLAFVLLVQLGGLGGVQRRVTG